MVHFDPKRKEFTPYGFTCERWEPVLMYRPDKHNEIELNYCDQGQLTYLFWGERVTVEGGRPAVFWAATPHQIVDYEDIDSYFVITLPLPWVLSWDLPSPFITQLLNGQLLQENQQLSAGYPDRQIFEQWYQDMTHHSEHCHEIVLLEIKARLLRLAANLIASNAFASGTSNSSSKPVGTQSVSKIECIAKFIAQNYTKNICTADIAKEVKLHPDYAADLFRKTFGVTLNHFITQYRVQHAQRMLVTTNNKILDIAYESGFNSLSRFNASFKQLCGCTPREYRAAHQLHSS
ncbi:MAG TPA: helix-turn-helix domain-containing protein [Anaerohalosphaeraceae bacterium]|nr:helix-turn-helix domain-containing protein [Phycisphaerae bacterium]HOL31365.1 helix-turn-helix domain-containing protein [Anaerohalosphaeraceae bacterium]HOM75179.1 helix-turn-helix domain-containing protein [Anaerohalosphaeraceae bacterium]HPO69694.1 helix-turn-helix domain-containing protein [Anaerohalosphaeraceae bacterium]HRS72061.1 helix-turn-helix domain-containing protein [Anaerohalosphaeraceae bacterium]